MAEGFSRVGGEVMVVERGDSILDTTDSMHDMTTDSLESFSVGFGRGVTFSDEEMVVEGEGRDEVTLSPELVGMPVGIRGASGVGRGDGGWIEWGVGSRRRVGKREGSRGRLGERTRRGAEGSFWEREGYRGRLGGGAKEGWGSGRRAEGGWGSGRCTEGGWGSGRRAEGGWGSGRGTEEGWGSGRGEEGCWGSGRVPRVDGRRRVCNVQRGKGELFVVGKERGGMECVGPPNGEHRVPHDGQTRAMVRETRHGVLAM